jgi:hypothetical protein
MTRPTLRTCLTDMCGLLWEVKGDRPSSVVEVFPVKPSH